jgi:hypothetical protein
MPTAKEKPTMSRLPVLAFLALPLALGCGNGADQPARTATAAPPATASAAALPAGAVDLVSGVSLGPVKVGMQRAEVDALGLPTKKGPMPGDLVVGPYLVLFEGETVRGVHVTLKDLPGGVRIGGKVFVAEGGTTIKSMAPALTGCGLERVNLGANVILCDDGKTELIAGGPPGIVALQINDAKRAAQAVERDKQSYGTAGDKAWKHASLPLSLHYDDKLLKLTERPDGVVMQSEVLGKIEDRTDSPTRNDKPQPLTITVTVKNGKLEGALKPEHIAEKDCESGSMAGHVACRFSRGSHDIQQELTFAEVGAGKTVVVLCDYLGGMGKPKVSFEDQRKACQQVVSSLQYKP